MFIDLYTLFELNLKRALLFIKNDKENLTRTGIKLYIYFKIFLKTFWSEKLNGNMSIM